MIDDINSQLNKIMNKIISLVCIFALVGCATNPEVEKSVSRDNTMNDMAKMALINEMLTSRDPVVRAKGAEAAAEFLKKEKRGIFEWK